MSKQITITNMVNDPSIRPEGMSDLFDKIDKRVEDLTNLDNAINAAKNSINELFDNKSKGLGALDMLTELVTEKLTDEDIDKHGNELVVKKEEPVSEESL